LPLSLRIGSRRLVAAWWMTGLTLAAVLLFAGLGRWQWQRAQDKRQLQQHFAAGSLRVEPLEGRPLGALRRYTQIRVAGRYDPGHQFLLDNISRNGRAGFEVLTPLILSDGRTLLVNRGWMPLRDGGRAQYPDVSLADVGEIPVTGRVDLLPVTGIEAGRAPPPLSGEWPRVTSFPDSADLSRALGRAVEPGQLLLGTDQPHGYQRDWQAGSASFGPERHLAYAVQWWSFAALAVFLLLFLNLRRDHKR
jgi:surfeit locus 1 family protein